MECPAVLQRIVAGVHSLAATVLFTAVVGCAGHHLEPDHTCDQCRVEAQIVSAASQPYGGQFAIIGRDTKRVLAAGRTDAMGQVSAIVTTDGRDSALVLLVQSRGMIGNAYDEWRGNIVPRWPYSDAPLADIVVDARSQASIAQIWTDDPMALLDDLGTDGNEQRRTIFGCGANRDQVLDVVAKTVAHGCSEVVNFGEIRFPWVHAAVELDLTLEDEDGDAIVEPVVLGGFEGFPERPGKNKVYPHMALAQRGARIRILFSRAAATLLFADPADFLVLRSVVSKEFESLAVALPDGARREIGGYPWKLTFRAKVTKNNKRTGDLLRAAPRQPALWWFLEHSLRW